MNAIRKWHDVTDEKIVRIAFQRGMRIIAKSLYRTDGAWKIYASEEEMRELRR